MTLGLIIIHPQSPLVGIEMTRQVKVDDILTQVPTPDYRKNISAITSQIRSMYPRTTIIFLTPSMVDTAKIAGVEEALGMPEEFRSHRTSERAREIAEACLEAARKEHVDCLDVFQMHGGLDGAFTDGLHFSPRGYEVSLQQRATLAHSGSPYSRLCSISSPPNTPSSCRIPSHRLFQCLQLMDVLATAMLHVMRNALRRSGRGPYPLLSSHPVPLLLRGPPPLCDGLVRLGHVLRLRGILLATTCCAGSLETGYFASKLLSVFVFKAREVGS